MSVERAPDTATARSFDAGLATIATRLRESTVQVRTARGGSGSGVIWRPEGVIVTNAHVTSGESATVELPDGRTVAARVADRDPDRDLARLEADAFNLVPAPVRSSESLRVGELVVAVGNPLGVAGALTTGVVHSVGRPARVRRGRFGTSRRALWVQADIRLQPGNSGGPLADARGRVVGINTMIVGGLALAVPSLDVERFVNGTPNRPRLGIRARDVVAVVQGRPCAGLHVDEVSRGSAAARAGLVQGDVVIGSNGVGFDSRLDAIETLREAGLVGNLSLDVIRRGRVVSIHIARALEAA